MGLVAWWSKGREGKWGSLRGCVCLREDVSVFEILGIGAHLEVFLEGFFALDGGDGGVFDVRVCFLCCHVELVDSSSRFNVCQNLCLVKYCN